MGNDCSHKFFGLFKQIHAFSKYFNVLLLDLRGHGKSKRHFSNVFKKYTDSMTQDIIELLNKEKLKLQYLGNLIRQCI